MVQSIQDTFSDDNRIKLKISNRKIPEKHLGVCEIKKYGSK